MGCEHFYQPFCFFIKFINISKLPEPLTNLMKFIALILLLYQLPGFSQTPGNAIIKSQQLIPMNGLNGSRNAFIKNIGQYGDTMAEHVNMGSIKYGYEGNDMLVLFTSKGLIHLHRKIKRPSEKEEKEMERKGIPEEEIEKKVTITEKVIKMEWLDANPNTEIIAEEQTTDYHTYGLLKDKAYGYRKIIYKNLYPGIDVIYHFTNTNKTGFEYSIVLQPGANPELIKMKYGGDIKNIKVDKAGNLVIKSGINGIIETAATAFSNTDAIVKLSVDKGNPQQLYNVSFQQQNKLVNFSVPGYDKTKILVIDPFVSNTNTLTGANNAGKAIDIDFDYAGNIYVAGGGSSNACKLAKYDPSGTLLWTFSGTVTTPSWMWGEFYGGWVVEKSSGNIFIGQGYYPGGARVIRLLSTGVYDNYITNANPSSSENWKMLWNCNNGNPQIFIAGGGVTSNINFGICTPPSTSVSISNITGLSFLGQDIADIVVDPLTNDMYTIFASNFGGPQGVNNRIFKNSPPYNPSTLAWQVPTGYTSLQEGVNRPYMGSENSMNALAINSSYIYYWDGLYLKAFNKADGSTVGTPLTLTGNTVKMQGGIIADECNNIFIGNINGTIKVYKFDGVTFNDAASPDISIPGFPSASVYDLAYDDARRLLYASGNGFVASFDITSYCTASSVFNLTVTPDCPTLSAQANISPTPPVGTTINYVLFAGATQIASNATGLFTGLVPGINYTIKAFLNQACSGTQVIQNFSLIGCPVPEISATFINPSCNLSNGSINAVAINGTPAYQFSKDGINFQSSGIFTGLAAGNYSVIVKDAFNFSDTINITLINSFPLQVTATPAASSCTQNTGVITAVASGGAAPLKYSIDGISFGASGIFTGLATGRYTITVKDTNACIATIPVYVDSLNTVTANAGGNITICQGGKQTLAAVSNGNSFLWTPSTGLSNPNILTPDASPATATNYTLTATTGICKATSSLKVFISPPAKLFVGNDTIIAINQPLSLQGIDVNNTGFINYTWSPAYGLNNPFAKDPVAVLDRDIMYTVVAQNVNGCIGTDDIKIKVYKGPEIYVPNAFTPGSDNLNDVLKPIIVGMKALHYFRIFNSYGQLVFSTANAANGWDGNFKGSQQPMGTYVWMAEAVDYRGNTIQRKGSVTLIR
jgi:gliding motility-associated-like protein